MGNELIEVIMTRAFEPAISSFGALDRSATLPRRIERDKKAFLAWQINKFSWVRLICQIDCLRPYHVESTSSRPITEVKQHRVVLVLGWVTAWEYTML